MQWGKYQTQRVDEVDLTNWFKGTDYDIAIITGKVSGIVVVDIDPKRGSTLKGWLDRYPTNLIVRTGSGGAHCYYRYPEGLSVGNAVDLEPGIDLRGDGGYVVAPPSRHSSGGRYEWVSTGEPADFPLDVLRKQEVKHEQQRTENWITSLLANGAGEGSRNDALASLAGYFASRGEPVDIARTVLSYWNQKNSPPIDAREFERTIQSVYETARRRTPERPVAQLSSPTLGDKDFRLMSFEDYMGEYGQAMVDWVIPEWLPEQTIAFLISPPGTFKTWLLLDAAVSIAMGAKFLGLYPVRNPGPVFLIQQEDYHGQTAERIAVIRKSKVDEDPTEVDNDTVTFTRPSKLPLYVHPDRAFRFDDERALKSLETSIAQIRPKLIILDPLYSAADTENYMADSIKHMMFFKGLRDKYGCSFLIAHHTNKSEREDRMRAWGTQFLNAFLETGWQLFRKGETSIKCKRHFKASANETDVMLSFDIDTKFGFHYEVCEGAVDATEEIKPKKSKPEVEEEKEKIADPPPPQPQTKAPFKPANIQRPDVSTLSTEQIEIIDCLYTSKREVETKALQELTKLPKAKLEDILYRLLKLGYLKKRVRTRFNKPVAYWTLS